MAAVPRATRRRILLVTTHYHPVLGGVETHARDVATGLRSRGRRVVVLTTRHVSTDRRVQRIDRVPVVRTPPSVGRQRFTKWLFLPVVVWAAIRLRRHFDVIFCPDLRGLGMAVIAAGWWLDVPVVIQGATPGAYSASHWDASIEHLPIRPPRLLVDALKRAMFAVHRRAQAAVCITRAHEDEARASGIDAARVHYVPHGVDTDRFRPASREEQRQARQALGWGDDGPVVLFLGRLSREKGLLELLEAWASMPASGARLVIVGPDVTGHSLDAGPDARAFVRARGLDSSVTFAGPTSTPEACLRASDILVQPSHYEAFPVTVIEAMACGLAVAASYVGGLRDYLADGENALVFQPGEPRAIAEALDRLVADPVLRVRLATAGRATVLAQFDRTRNLESYERIFDSVLRPSVRGASA